MTAWATESMTVASPHHPQSCFDSCLAMSVGPVTLMCVADGAGTEPSSMEASRLAVSLVGKHFSESAEAMERRAPFDASCSVARKLVDRAATEFFRQLGLDPQDMSRGFNTTLAVVVILGSWVSIALVGDAIVVFHGKHGVQLSMVGQRPSGQANSATYMLGDWRDHTIGCEFWIPDVNAIMLSTDGLERLITFKAVADANGVRRQVAVGVNSLIADALIEFAGGQTGVAFDSLRSAIDLKGDDIGVTIAYR